MEVFNPGRTPVTVDAGRVVPAGEWSPDIPDGPRVRRALEADPPRLVLREDAEVAAPDKQKKEQRA